MTTKDKDDDSKRQSTYGPPKPDVAPPKREGQLSPCCGAEWIPPQPDAPDYLENVTTCPDCGKQYTKEQLKEAYAAAEQHGKAAKDKPNAH